MLRLRMPASRHARIVLDGNTNQNAQVEIILIAALCILFSDIVKAGLAGLHTG